MSKKILWAKKKSGQTKQMDAIQIRPKKNKNIGAKISSTNSWTHFTTMLCA